MEVRRLAPGLLWPLLLGTALLALGTSLLTGPVMVTPTEFWRVLWFGSDDPTLSLVVRDVRWPRTLLASLVGAALAVSGALLQGLFRNPLADPGLIGVSSGAMFGAVAVIVLTGSAFQSLSGTSAMLLLPASAFIGAMLATALVWCIGGAGKGGTATLLLAGIAINALLMAVTGLLIYAADDLALRTLTFWTMGSVAQATHRDYLLLAPVLLWLLLAIPGQARALNALQLGEAVAAHMGVNVASLKRTLVVLVALTVAAAVSVSGLIGFVGLVAPHMVRLLLGPDHRLVLPATALLGAVLLLLADSLARILVAPAELPVGLVMSLIGGPFFLWLLVGQRRVL